VTTDTAVPFDQVAASYDRQWTSTPIGRAQRDLVWRHIDPLFHPGDRILDLGCGTGADAAHFAERGLSVHATDPSPGMIQVARRRGGFTVEVLGAEEIATIQETFDGAISNFGALNCVDDLAAAARGLAGIVRPGGSVAICTIGRFCAWETLYYAARGQFSKAFRRFRGSAPSSLGGTVHYHSVAELRSAFADFELQRWTGIGLFVPPSYVRMPGWLVRWCSALDRALCRVPMLRAMADHRLLIFVRTPHAR
jgi:ubiquinone/menaquinone biosynthesis C-methylase UbiE